ncbi:MAG: DUF11 domain-containing protein [Candidatus Pacebacteria bacterium]|nr:DUF11 domain-containing protein [Candidatus Paceibacterota bacterium]
MKKIIYTTLAAFFGLALMATPSFAGSEFNNPGAMPTITITNSTRNACSYGPIDSCWQASTTAQAGDVVAVHIYYKNTSNTASQGTTLGLSPQSSAATTSVSFSGGVASLSGPRAVGSASVSISSSQSLSYIPGSGKWYPSATSGTRSIDAAALFGSSGFNIGTVNPGEQGVLVAFFQVSNNVTQNYQCNDGIDNDGDGLTDYPTDPGCSSPTDNDEYNQVVVSQCVINSFYASPTSVSSGGYTTLYWSTSNCDSVTVDGISYPINGSGSFGPLYSGRNYELRAFKNGQVQTRSTFVSVNQVQNPTYQCNDGYDNDGDGKVDYPNDPGCSSYNDNDEYNQVIQNTQPQAITTVATILGTTSARLNGIAVPNSSYNTTAWFQWGTNSNLSFKTNSQSVNTNTSTYISDTVSGLIPNTTYYYRTVVQNQNGTAYGDIVKFQTQKNTVVSNPPTVITKVITRDVVVAKSTASLLELRVENVYDRMCINGEMDYTVSYKNISSQTLQNSVLRVTLPKELTLINSSRGDYEVVDRTITIALGDIPAGGSGTVQVRAKVNTTAVIGNLAVTTATVVYTNTITRAQEDAIAYSLVNISNDCPNVNVLGASAFGLFLPSTLLGWLILILVILALIVIGRQLARKKE